jgi:hypothetical protein
MIALAAAMREKSEEEVIVIVIAVLKSSDVTIGILMSLSTALHADEREQANGGRASQNEDSRAH